MRTVEPRISVVDEFQPEQLRIRKTKKTCREEKCNEVKERGEDSMSHASTRARAGDVCAENSAVKSRKEEDF
jgi:hypothetical protein